MQLELQTQRSGKVMVIRCGGRIVTGKETQLLQQEIEKHAIETKRFVLQMADVKFVDSGGLGAMVRLAGMLRAYHGDLKLCEVSPFVHQVLEATALLKVFQTYPTENEAVDAFREGPHQHGLASSGAGAKIFCIDSSVDLLAYLGALLKRSGYDVTTAHRLSDAKTLAKVRQPDAVVCGPAIHTDEFAMENLRHSAPNAKFIMLSADFSTKDASHAGVDLVEQLRALFNPPQA
jgi:anti-anti-sigma factor